MKVKMKGFEKNLNNKVSHNYCEEQFCKHFEENYCKKYCEKITDLSEKSCDLFGPCELFETDRTEPNEKICFWCRKEKPDKKITMEGTRYIHSECFRPFCGWKIRVFRDGRDDHMLNRLFCGALVGVRGKCEIEVVR